MNKITSILIGLLLVLMVGCRGGITGSVVEDTIPPSITITETTTTADSAFISWTTDENANSTFNSSITIQDYTYSTAFNITLGSLNENTAYNYVIYACDNSSNCDSVTGSFTTNTTPDTTAPTISITTDVSETTASINWTSDESANSTFIIDSTSTDYTFAESFEKQLISLTAGTQYSFTIISCDSAENCGTTNSQFTTQAESDTTAPTISISSSVAAETTTLVWTTDESANSTFIFNSTSTDYDFETTFSKQLDNLNPSTAYQATVISCDSSENCNTETHDFTTSAQSLALTIVNEETTIDTAVVNWTTDKQATSSFRYSNVMITYSANTVFGASLEDLLENSTYIYNVSACISDYCTSFLDNFTTDAIDSIAPSMTANVTDIDHDSAEFEWTVDENANSTFRFNNTVTEYDFDTSFSKTVSSLNSSTDYEANITVCDSSNNCNSTLLAFTTNSTPDTAGPTILIGSVQVQKESATIPWTTDEEANCTITIESSSTHYASNTAFTHTAGSLSPGTVYSFTIQACDSSLNCADSSRSFTTLPAEVMPPPEPTVESPAPVQTAEEETAPRVGGFVIQPQPEVAEAEELTFFEKIKKLTSDHLLLIMLSLILTLTVVFNVSYLKMSKSGPASNAEELIGKANMLIQQGKPAQAYQLYPHIMANYNKIEKAKHKRQVHKKLSFLYAQLQLHTALTNAETLTEQYYNGQLLEDSVPVIMQHLDQIPVLLEQLKKFLPQHHHEKAHRVVMHRHSKCLTKIYQKRKSSDDQTGQYQS